MTFFDSHAHLTSSNVYEELPEILERAKSLQVLEIVNICTDIDSLEKALALQNTPVRIYHTAATTPHDVDKDGEVHFPFIAQAARTGKLVAIGETGLDYHYFHSSKETQQKFLIRYLELALECNLPVVIHCRNAFEDLFDITDKYYKINNKFAPLVLHCFTGTLDEAKEVIARGWYLSLSGIMTFKKSVELHEVAKWAPLEQLFIETDSPYLAPEGKRGQPNEPAFLPLIAQTIARLRNTPVTEVAAATTQNARLFFRCTT